MQSGFPAHLVSTMTQGSLVRQHVGLLPFNTQGVVIVARFPVFGEHLVISLVPWLAAVIVGGGLGYLLAVLVRWPYARPPGLRRPSTLVPWRTVATALTFVALSPAVPVFTGLGPLAGATMVLLFAFVWAMPCTASIVLDHWYPSSLAARLVGGFRTLAIATVSISTLTPTMAGSGGAGRLLFQEGWQLLDYPAVVSGFLVVVLLALAIDLLLGGLQILLPRPSRRPGQGITRSVNHARPMPRNADSRAATEHA
jgi:hypothetical protein